MSGWIALLLLIALSLAILWMLRVRGAMLQLAGAALLFGAAGYAAFGRPGLAVDRRGQRSNSSRRSRSRTCVTPFSGASDRPSIGC